MAIKYNKKKFAVYLVIAIIFFVVIWAGLVNTNGEIDFKQDKVIITNSLGEEIEIDVLIAEKPEERKQGLMNRESLCWDCGMLFVYEEDVEQGFWMKDTLIPLSIAFVAENGTILEIHQMEPETTNIHKPEQSYRYALEVNQGFFEEEEIGAGDSVSIPKAYIS